MTDRIADLEAVVRELRGALQSASETAAAAISRLERAERVANAILVYWRAVDPKVIANVETSLRAWMESKS